MSSALRLSSPAFEENGQIPPKHTCDGDGISPELRIGNVPEGTKSLVLVMDDPDIPEDVKTRMQIESFDHWVLYNIPPSTTVLPEGMDVGTSGMSSQRKTGYVGPCPPDREHRYFFRLYALPGTLTFVQTPTLKEVEEAAKGSMLASTTLMARYTRVTPQQ
jgi:Raf kinase inhibitor-like YbhB/YbcL family protein